MQNPKTILSFLIVARSLVQLPFPFFYLIHMALFSANLVVTIRTMLDKTPYPYLLSSGLLRGVISTVDEQKGLYARCRVSVLFFLSFAFAFMDFSRRTIEYS